MPEKLVTMDAPTDYTPNIKSTGFHSTNINRVLDTLDDGEIRELLRVAKLSVAAQVAQVDRDAEIEAFVAVRAPVGVAEYRIGVLSADIERHLLSLRQDIRIRTAEQQAELTLSDLEEIIGELLLAREKLLGVLGRSDAEPQQEAN